MLSVRIREIRVEPVFENSAQALTRIAPIGRRQAYGPTSGLATGLFATMGLFAAQDPAMFRSPGRGIDIHPVRFSARRLFVEDRDQRSR